MALETMRFPGESEDYREARDRLLAAEAGLREEIERIAALRRALPPGGLVPEDYVFAEATPERGNSPVRLSELLPPDRESLIVYSMMYGPDAETPCPLCTSIVDGLDANAPHVSDRSGLVVVAKSPPERISELARARGWRRIRLLSSAGNSYNTDYLAEDVHGCQMPMMNVFVRRAGELRHFWGSELLYSSSSEGQDQRHVDLVWPLWNLLDLTPEGRGAGWYPKLSYDR